jgi:hypothetical protein
MNSAINHSPLIIYLNTLSVKKHIDEEPRPCLEQRAAENMEAASKPAVFLPVVTGTAQPVEAFPILGARLGFCRPGLKPLNATNEIVNPSWI